jgi:hypothetical protein
MEPGNGLEIAAFTVTFGVAVILVAVFVVGAVAMG